ncbi:MAG: thiamine-phosphate kinase [Rikenellaceae bacterium]
MKTEKHTPISSLGEFKLIDKLTQPFESSVASTVKAVGDDAAIIDCGDKYMVLSTDLMLEGIHFDLTYFPLKHLGFKAVVVAISDICAMNARASQLTVSLGLSSKISVEMLEELYEGINLACKAYGVDLVGGDTSASVNGLTISLTAVGFADKDKVVYRSGAKENDLICVSGNLGAAYMGLRLLEREKRVLTDVDDKQPKFEGYKYLLQKQLRPEARVDVVDEMASMNVVPTSMIDVSDGLAFDLRHICSASNVGARIYLDRLPIAQEVYNLCEELHNDPVTAVFNGGDEYELLFTLPLEKQEVAIALGADIIGHITAEQTGVALVTPDGGEISLEH